MMYGRGQVHGRAQAGGPLGKICRGLATGVGLASEGIHHHKERKRAQKQQEEQQQQRDTLERAVPQDDRAQGDIISREDDEEAWQLDEAQQEFCETGQAPSTPDSPEQIPKLADTFIRNHPPPIYSESTSPSPAAWLPLPVVLTQRRPKARDRGFVKAYAPILEDVGIDQASFLDFIDNLNKAVEPSPWIQAINLAGLFAQHVPLAVSIAISVALKVTADAASEVHSRTKTNSFLDRINEDYFKPRGLVVLLMTWKPQDPSAVTTVNFDLGTTIANTSSDSSQGTFAKVQGRLKASSAATSFEFTETAPLVFPALDELASSAVPSDENPEAEAKKQNIVKRGGGFVGDYLDRRAVALWAGENPGSRLANAAPTPEFRSRYADPNNPASSGDPLAFITGGKISHDSLAQRIPGGVGATARGGFGRGSIMEGRYAALEARGFGRGGWGDRRAGLGSSSPALFGGNDQPGSFSRGATGVGGIGPLSLIGGVKKLLQKDVLYLMVANLPTEEEMAQAAEYLQ